MLKHNLRATCPGGYAISNDKVQTEKLIFLSDKAARGERENSRKEERMQEQETGGDLLDCLESQKQQRHLAALH